MKFSVKFNIFLMCLWITAITLSLVDFFNSNYISRLALCLDIFGGFSLGISARELIEWATEK